MTASVMSYQIEAEKFLISLADILMESSLIEVDEIPEGLSVLTNRGQYLLNYHKTTRQIWVSSPLSGAHHFFYNGSNWYCTRTHCFLSELLHQEFTSLGCMVRELP